MATRNTLHLHEHGDPSTDPLREPQRRHTWTRGRRGAETCSRCGCVRHRTELHVNYHAATGAYLGSRAPSCVPSQQVLP